jgi:hypothetical protein
MSDDDAPVLESAAPGTWLPLADAIRALGITEYQAYRFVRDDKLRAREWDGGRIEVWVADEARSNELPGRSVAVSDDRLSLDVVERLAAMFHQQVGQLLRPLAEAHERSLELARENGALAERVEAAERAPRDDVDRQPELDHLREQLRDVEAAHARLAAMLDAQQPREMVEPSKSPQGQSPPFVIGAIILAVVTIAFVFFVVTNLVAPRTVTGPSSLEIGFETALEPSLSVVPRCSAIEMPGLFITCLP